MNSSRKSLLNQGVCFAAISLFVVSAATLRAGDSQRSYSVTREEVVRLTSAQASLRAAKAIEQMRRHLEEWGTVNVSQPLLYPVNGQFSLGAAAEFPSYKDYYGTELTNVTAAAGQLSQTGTSASVTATYNAPQFTATPQPSASASPESVAPISEFPLAAPAAAAPSDAPASQTKSYLDQATFHKPGELIGTLPNGNAPRSAVTQAATDKITELLLRQMANPVTPDDGSKLCLAIFQVTCNPGWRTLKGYMADVFLHWEYAQLKTNEKVNLSLSRGAPTAPEVVAILPLVDAQNMDLRNSQRELYSLLVSMAASGALGGDNAAGKGVLDFIHSYQKDAASRNAMPVVNSYTTTFGMGFRFSPSFVAMADPARKKSAAANVLIPTSFPVLAIVRFREEDTARADVLAWHTNFRWLIRDRRVSFRPWDWHLPERREDEGRRLRVAWNGAAALRDLTAAYGGRDDADVSTDPDYQLLRTDYHELSYKIGTNWSYSPLKYLFAKPKPPSIATPHPEMVDPLVDTRLTIQGRNLKPDGLRVFFGGQECTVLSVENDSTVIALFKSAKVATKRRSEPGMEKRRWAELVVATKSGTDSRDIEIDLTPQEKAEEKRIADEKKKVVQVTRDADGHILAVDLSRIEGLSTKDILDATVKILGVEETPPKAMADASKHSSR